MSFKNQIVVVTGGAKGIERGLVESFAKENAEVINKIPKIDVLCSN